MTTNQLTTVAALPSGGGQAAHMAPEVGEAKKPVIYDAPPADPTLMRMHTHVTEEMEAAWNALLAGLTMWGA